MAMDQSIESRTVWQGSHDGETIEVGYLPVSGAIVITQTESSNDDDGWGDCVDVVEMNLNTFRYIARALRDAGIWNGGY